jgi:hypothetical protein
MTDAASFHLTGAPAVIVILVILALLVIGAVVVIKAIGRSIR